MAHRVKRAAYTSDAKVLAEVLEVPQCVSLNWLVSLPRKEQQVAIRWLPLLCEAEEQFPRLHRDPNHALLSAFAVPNLEKEIVKAQIGRAVDRQRFGNADASIEDQARQQMRPMLSK
jgi:hypothetical protein